MKRIYPFLILAIALAGCAPLPRDLAFQGEPGKAFLVIAAEGYWQGNAGKFFLRLQPLNAAKNGFAKPQTVAYFTGTSDYPDDEFAKPKSSNPSIRLAGLHLAPGDYAVVAFIADGYGERGPTTIINCYAQGTAVYHVKEGVVNVVRYHANHDRPLDEDTVKSDLAATLAGYPNITAPVEMARPIGSISFQSSTNILGNPTCDPDGPLSFKPLPSP